MVDQIGVDSFDGAKLSLEGAANGWYYQKNEVSIQQIQIANLQHLRMICFPNNPFLNLEQRIGIGWGKMGGSCTMIQGNVFHPALVQHVRLSCLCPVQASDAGYTKITPITNMLRILWMMGSTEHNMGESPITHMFTQMSSLRFKTW